MLARQPVIHHALLKNLLARDAIFDPVRLWYAAAKPRGLLYMTGIIQYQANATGTGDAARYISITQAASAHLTPLQEHQT